MSPFHFLPNIWNEASKYGQISIQITSLILYTYYTTYKKYIKYKDYTFYKKAERSSKTKVVLPFMTTLYLKLFMVKQI
jgi:hypothetical protein